MANKRTLKRAINGICEELFADCIAASLYGAVKHPENADALLSTIIKTESDFIARVSHPEPGMTAKAYYKDLRKACGSNGHDYAFDPVQNSDPEKAYFCGMTYRLMRGLQYLKSRPEWDGKNLIVAGGSQGGLQTSWAAGLDKDVTLARPFITWGCNWGFVDGTRIRGPWHIPWAPGLGYYDAVSHIARAKCPVEITRAGLGDYTCPPSGLALFYNAIKAPKSIVWVQGSRHGHTPVGDNQVYVETSDPSAKRK